MLASTVVVRRLTLFAMAAASVVGCGGRARPPVGVTVVVDGADAAAARSRLERARIDGLVLRPIAAPAPPPPAPDPVGDALALAWKAYYAEEPSFDACRAAVDAIDIPALLGAGKRELAARVLVWRTACAWAALDRAGAGVHAAQLASFGLELPSDARVVTPDVEQLLGRAIADAGRTARVPLRVEGPRGARLVVDGKPAGCALPCTTDAVPGDHVVAAIADGLTPAWRVARVPADGAVTLTAAPASPELAAAQWQARRERGFPAADDAGLALLARAAGDARVAYVAAGARVSGGFVVDGAVKARVTRADGDVVGLVRDLAIRGDVLPAPPLYKQPRFWIATAAVAVIAASVTAAIVFQPGIRTELGW
jgi:hypothetical protein